MTKKDDDFDDMPIKNHCQYLLLKMIADSGGKMSTYRLMKEGRKLDICDSSGMEYSFVAGLVDLWAGHGLIEAKPPFVGSGVNWLKITPAGLDLLEKLKGQYGDD